jgi:hypothetical protein
MVTISLQDLRRPIRGTCSACRSRRSGVKIAQLLEGTSAEHFAVSFAELWSLPVGEESVETVAGEI